MAPDQSAANLSSLPSAQPERVQESPSPPRRAACRQSVAPDQTAANFHNLTSAQPEIVEESPSPPRGAACRQSVVPVTASSASIHPPPLLVPEPPSAT